ncbi:MAG: hypothetical protein U0414_21290 [Polyangiaceae bacterium]
MGDLSNQKQVFFFVPNYDKSNASDSTGSPLSYVILGSAKTHEYLGTERLRGDDLLLAAGLATSSFGGFFADDSRGAACSACSEVSTPHCLAIHQAEAHASGDCLDATIAPLATTYYRSDSTGAFTEAASPSALTAEILGDGADTDPRGGLREHTDGNRIVTVRGDRVDVVVGNYKRVVFGRVSGDWVGATSYEAAGGHVLERSSADALQVYAIEHVKETDEGGLERWKVVERAENGDKVVRYSGVLVEHHNGPSRVERIGTDGESATKNPEISRTHRLDSDVRTIDASGSATWSVEADSLTEVTDGSDASSDEEVYAVSHLKSRGKLSQRRFTFKEELRAKVVAETSLYAGKARVSAGGAQFDDVCGHYKLSTGVRLSAHAGPIIRMNYGSRTRMNCGGNWVRACLGGSVSVDVGLYTELSFMTIWLAPIHHEGRIGNLQLNYTKAEATIGQSRALALLMEL